MNTFGSRAQVWHGTAKKTSGGLRKSALKKNSSGKIVSRRASASAKRTKNLQNSGYLLFTKGRYAGVVRRKAGATRRRR